MRVGEGNVFIDDEYGYGDLVRHKPTGCIGIFTWTLGNAMRVEFPCCQSRKKKMPCAAWKYEDCELVRATDE